MKKILATGLLAGGLMGLGLAGAQAIQPPPMVGAGPDGKVSGGKGGMDSGYYFMPDPPHISAQGRQVNMKYLRFCS